MASANPDDTNAVQCPLWAGRGDCNTNQQWMCAHCRGSCAADCALYTSSLFADAAGEPTPSATGTASQLPGQKMSLVATVELQSLVFALVGVALVVKLGKRLK